MADKIDRKSLREPDEFVTFSRRMFSWVATNRTTLVLLLLVGIVVAIGMVGYKAYKANVEQDASEAFAKAREILDAPVVASIDASGATSSAET